MINYEKISKVLVVLFYISVGILIIVNLTSCESKSNIRSGMPMEKVIILTNPQFTYDASGNFNKYKVKRISTSTVTYISLSARDEYVINDTIQYRFN